jgi:AraC family transcriptional regulator
MGATDLLDVVCIEVPAGRVDPDPDSYHVLDLHVSEPVRTLIRLDGQQMRGAQLPGDINVVPAGVAGSWVFGAPAHAVLLRLAPALLEEATDAMHLKPACAELRPALCMRDPHIAHIGSMLKGERLANQPRGRLWWENAAYSMALRLVRRSNSFLTLPRSMGRALPKWRLRTVCDYIEANLVEDLSLRELAAVAGFSVPHFKVLFKQSIGLPVHRYVVERRVERARQLLIQAGRPMAEIALDAGFAHQSHMIRCVQRVLGITPAQIVALCR